MFINTKTNRLLFFLYLSCTFLAIAILIIYKGLNSPWPWMLIPLLIFAPVLYIKFVRLPYLMWKNAYNVGVEEIDYDHKRLVELLNRVVMASSHNMGENFSLETLNKLIDYAKYHLDREEKLMEKYEYPDKENHTLQHGKFAKSIHAIEKEHAENDTVKHTEIFDFLAAWLLKHIAKTDKDLGAFIQKKRAGTPLR